LDLCQRTGDDLYVHNRHDEAGDHRQDADPIVQSRCRRRFARHLRRRHGRGARYIDARWRGGKLSVRQAYAPQRWDQRYHAITEGGPVGLAWAVFATRSCDTVALSDAPRAGSQPAMRGGTGSIKRRRAPGRPLWSAISGVLENMLFLAVACQRLTQSRTISHRGREGAEYRPQQQHPRAINI